ncbi:uncharacterized protein LOC129793522 [Lutzomyia longipalpis]|uniref:uncharacterized protein LOC129793522 n=1 Tax=Lutzomyia longipalpis TaxID=7200 RepID=UPI0024834FDC|nr:uncharacterized protein LOC129793522 [Lutzomyia longipalpis]
MSLYRVSFLPRSFYLERKDCARGLCLKISLEGAFEIHFPIEKFFSAGGKKGVCFRGKKCIFHLKECTCKEAQLIFSLHRKCSTSTDDLLASNSVHITEFEQLETKLNLKREKAVKKEKEIPETIEKSTCASSSIGSFDACECDDGESLSTCLKAKKLIPLLNCSGESVAFVVICMNFSILGETLVEEFAYRAGMEPLASVRANKSLILSCGETSAKDTEEEEEEDAYETYSRCLERMLLCMGIDPPPKENFQRAPRRPIRGVINHPKLPQIKGNTKYPTRCFCHELRSSNEVITQPELPQVPTDCELHVKVSGDTLCPLVPCSSIEFTWKLPEIPPNSLRTTETQIEEDLLKSPKIDPETPIGSVATTPTTPKKSKKKLKGKKTGRKARKSKKT